MALAIGLDTAVKALRAHQLAVDVASHNIANAQSPGFSRQRVLLRPLASTVLIAPAVTPSWGGRHGRRRQRRAPHARYLPRLPDSPDAWFQGPVLRLLAPCPRPRLCLTTHRRRSELAARQVLGILARRGQ